MERQKKSAYLEHLRMLGWPSFLFLSLQAGEEADALLMACGPHHVELVGSSGGRRTGWITVGTLAFLNLQKPEGGESFSLGHGAWKETSGF